MHLLDESLQPTFDGFDAAQRYHVGTRTHQDQPYCVGVTMQLQQADAVALHLLGQRRIPGGLVRQRSTPKESHSDQQS